MDQAPSTKDQRDRVSVLADAVRVRELSAVLLACESAGASPIVFKGAALAHTHYAESWQRPRCDADVLIAPECRQSVFATLQTLGYRRGTLISGDLVMYQAPFARVDHLGIDHAIDVHWRISNPQVVSHVLTHGELVQRSVTVPVHGYALRVPSPVDSLLLACIHRVAHHPGVENPIWIEDIHRLASRFEPSEWQAFVERATSGLVRAICREGLARAQEQCHTVVPSDVLAALSGAGREVSAIFLREDLRPFDRLRADLRALGPRAAARLMREHLFPPAQYMQETYGVSSRALLPACYVARVLNGVGKWLRPYVSATR